MTTARAANDAQREGATKKTKARHIFISPAGWNLVDGGYKPKLLATRQSFKILSQKYRSPPQQADKPNLSNKL